jgi:hypothetical protein
MLVKIAAPLPSLVVEVHEQELQNGQHLLWAQADHLVPVERRY